jgi:hypothetical protein
MSRKPNFNSAAAFKRTFQEYVRYCKSDDVHKLPNTAGFCCYCNITRADFFDLKKKYPLEFDVAMSTLLDEALNTKVSNTSATLDYIRGEINGYTAANSSDGVEVICGHDSFEDGA